MLQFDGPKLTTERTMMFARGDSQVVVDRAEVVISRYDGTGGWNQWGA
jgi:hypothetical protein